MQVTANVFITALHGLRGDISAVAVTEGPATSPSPPWSVVSLFTVCQTGWSKGVLSFVLHASRLYPECFMMEVSSVLISKVLICVKRMIS